MSDKWIRASEINDYVYCRRAWWLRRVAGRAPQNKRELEWGRAYHQQHGRSLQRAAWSAYLVYALVFVTVSVLVFSILTVIAS